MAVGPYSTIESMTVAFVATFVMKTYDCPIAVAGMTAEIMPLAKVPGTLVMSRPLTKVTKKDDGRLPLTEKVKVMPGAAGMPWVGVRVGNAFTGRATLVLGQDLMNAAAMVYTSLRPSAVPYGLAGAIWPRLKRCTDWCKLSVMRMAPATPR